MKNITTTNGETFTYRATCELAAMVYARFGEDIEASAAAWSRMMQNDTTPGDFAGLLTDYIGKAA